MSRMDRFINRMDRTLGSETSQAIPIWFAAVVFTLCMLLLSVAYTVPAGAQEIEVEDVGIRGYIMITLHESADPPPSGCEVVGAWEDGSIVAFCYGGTWLADGPDTSDVWFPYTGPLNIEWIMRVSAIG